MQTYRFTLRTLSAFGTPLAGDTLFGQLCWTLRHQLGNERLNALLQGYTEGQPFAVVSDALPAGHVPLPCVPSVFWEVSDADRKALKKKKWLPVDVLGQPFAQWQAKAKNDADVAHHTERAQPHNTINRQTGTTGTVPFAPYAMSQIWFHADMLFDLYVALDLDQLGLDALTAALVAIGSTGFGRDASIGLGKFALESEAQLQQWPAIQNANSYLSLGPCAPQGLGFASERSFYQVVTRFGRHGDVGVQAGSPFKRPVLLAKAGGVFWPETVDLKRVFIGQGLGGVAQPVSTTMPETVQQGYAPVIAIHLPLEVST